MPGTECPAASPPERVYRSRGCRCAAPSGWLGQQTRAPSEQPPQASACSHVCCQGCSGNGTNGVLLLFLREEMELHFLGGLKYATPELSTMFQEFLFSQAGPLEIPRRASDCSFSEELEVWSNLCSDYPVSLANPTSQLTCKPTQSNASLQLRLKL